MVSAVRSGFAEKITGLRVLARIYRTHAAPVVTARGLAAYKVPVLRAGGSARLLRRGQRRHFTSAFTGAILGEHDNPVAGALRSKMNQAREVNNVEAVVGLPPNDELVAKVDSAIERARRALLAQQHPEGYWQAPLEAHAEMNAEYIIFNRFMELPPDPELDTKLAKQILETQQGDGSWALFGIRVI